MKLGGFVLEERVDRFARTAILRVGKLGLDERPPVKRVTELPAI